MWGVKISLMLRAFVDYSWNIACERNIGHDKLIYCASSYFMCGDSFVVLKGLFVANISMG